MIWAILISVAVLGYIAYALWDEDRIEAVQRRLAKERMDAFKEKFRQRT